VENQRMLAKKVVGPKVESHCIFLRFLCVFFLRHIMQYDMHDTKYQTCVKLQLTHAVSPET